MGLLRPRRLIDDEGLLGALKILLNVLRSPTARKRVMSTRSTFRMHSDHLSAVALIATKPNVGR